MLVGICYLVIEGLLLSDKQGHVKMGKFLDDQKMHRLYEKFILEYYRFHYPQFHARAMYIDWAEESGNTDLLPMMKTDITLQHNNDTLIIDAKYYTHNVQEYNNRFIVSSNNLYQMYSYVKNYVDTNKVKKENVSGMLLYAKTEDEIQADSDYVISGNKISVKNLDLNTDFNQIKNHLNNIAESYFNPNE